MNNNKKIIIGLVACVIIGICFYFFYWTKTPAYSINIIRESVKKHDVNTFEKHVDLDTLYNKGYDDLYIAMGEITGENFSANPLLAGMIQMMKAPIVAEFKHKTMEMVKGNDNPPAADPSKQDNAPIAVANNMETKADFKNLDIKDISTISKESNSAIVLLKVHSPKLDKDFDLKIKMDKLSDGKWKLKEITNLTEFIIATDKAEKEKLAELDKPIKEEIYKNVQTVDARVRKSVTGNFIPSYALNLNYTVKNISDKNISNVTAYCDFRDLNGALVKSCPLNDFLNIPKNSTGNSVTIVDLNPFIGPDKKLIETTDTSKFKVSLKVMSITFEDGSKIERPTKLPDIKQIK